MPLLSHACDCPNGPTRVSFNPYSSWVCLSGFGISHHEINMATNKPMHMGCKTNVPTCWASIPVANGAIAPPELPTHCIAPRAATCIFTGTRRWTICTEQGATGPSNRPERATATESPGIEGTNQIRSSRMRAPTVTMKTKRRSPMRWAKNESVNRPGSY